MKALFKLALLTLALNTATACADDKHDQPAAKADAPEQATQEEHGTHEHGVAYLSISVGAEGAEIMLDTPLANLVGFEYEPSTDADKQKMQDARSQLEAGSKLFTLSAEAGCTLKHTDITERWEEAGHGDWEVTWAFTCTQPAALKEVSTQLFTAFPAGLHTLKVEWVTDKAASTQDMDKDGTIQLNP